MEKYEKPSLEVINLTVEMSMLSASSDYSTWGLDPYDDVDEADR